MPPLCPISGGCSPSPRLQLATLLHMRTPRLSLRAPVSALIESLPSLPSGPLPVLLLRRQDIVAIPATYTDITGHPAPGVVAGIVLGSVAGFLLLVWVVYTCINVNAGGAIFASSDFFVRGGGGGGARSPSLPPAPPSTRGRGARSAKASHRSSRRRSETVEVRRESSVRGAPASPPATAASRARSPLVERVIVEERVVERAPSRAPSRAPPTVRTVPSDELDEVVVIEEHSPAPRRKSRRKSSRSAREAADRGREERDSGYRNVDPMMYAGGGEPLRDLPRRDSRGSRYR